MAHVCYRQIVLQKSLLADERNFSGPLVRPTRGDVRDHIVSHKKRPWTFASACRALQRKRRLKIDFREIFGVVRFSTFATASTRLRHATTSSVGSVSKDKRTSQRHSFR
jgi:hypothetical protein